MKVEIPKTAQPVARILRRDVKRPKTMPRYSFGRARWWDGELPKGSCPMGLHPKATDPAPFCLEEFPAAKTRGDVGNFANWWDGLRWDDIEGAIDAIWPKKKRRSKR